MNATPPLSHIHHVTLTVSDVDRSIAWYCDLLDFEVMKRATMNGLDKVRLQRGEITVTFVGHGEQTIDGAFDERRIGLDHLSFAVPDLDALHAWMGVLDDRGIPHGPITQGSNGKLIAFRDPDNIALEFYTLS